MVVIGADEGGRVSESEALGSEELAVAGATVNLLVGSVASYHGVERSVALGAVEALLVPHGALGELLLGHEDHATASWTALARRGLYRGRVRVVMWTTRGNLLLTVEVTTIYR